MSSKQINFLIFCLCILALSPLSFANSKKISDSTKSADQKVVVESRIDRAPGDLNRNRKAIIDSKLEKDSQNEYSDLKLSQGEVREFLGENQIPLPSTVSQSSKDSESQPVLLAQSKESQVKEPNLYRVIGSLAIVLILGLALAFAVKRWGRGRNQKGAQANIQLISQFSLGPKKSLSLVMVAGEALLLGVTDQQINLIKPVSLIDDELPENIPQKFELQNYENQDLEEELFAAVDGGVEDNFEFGSQRERGSSYRRKGSH